jgi:N-methylhydantoinase B
VGEQSVQPLGEPSFTPPKYGVRRLGPARFVADTPGGGGWGDPFDRPEALVLRDVRDGLLSKAAAERDYGVVLSDDGLNVDRERTFARRNRRSNL